MSSAARQQRSFRLFVLVAMGAIYLAVGLATAHAQTSHPGAVTGVIDRVQFEGDQYYVLGWACQEGQQGSIGVHVYAGNSAY